MTHPDSPELAPSTDDDAFLARLRAAREAAKAAAGGAIDGPSEFGVKAGQGAKRWASLGLNNDDEWHGL